MSTDIQRSDNFLDTPLAAGLVEAIESQFGYQSWRLVRTIVAVSGGPDSVALLRGLLTIAQRNGDQQPSNLIVAHVDHGLRRSESAGDAEFVESLAARLGLKFVKSNSISLSRSHDSDDNELESAGASPSEESLRDFRYENLLATAMRLGARYIVTGHNQNDQIETILFRILRGTGLAGLSGIPSVRLGNDSVSIVRPLLKTRRSEIEAYLDEIKQDYRVDSSNSSSNYQRNYLRNELIPLIESRFGPGVESSLLRLSRQANQATAFIESQAESLGDAIVSRSPTSIQLDCSLLSSYPPILVRQFLVGVWIEQNWPRQAMGFDWWEKLCFAISVKDSSNQTARVLNLPGEISFSRNGNVATLSNQRDQQKT